jgi:hypothetical protein
MNISDIAKDPRFKSLKPSSFKAYFYLVELAGEAKKVQKFSIRGQVKKWKNDPEMNLSSTQDTLRMILDELEDAGLVTFHVPNRELTIL